MQTYTALIVDDEKAGRNSLRQLLVANFPKIQILAEASSALEAFESIHALQPDIVFLDIEMPYGSGFDLLDRFEQIPFQIIFVTAYEEYALRALKLSATDYLLKPIDLADLEKAIEKIYHKKHIKSTEDYKAIGRDFYNVAKPEKIALSSQEGVLYVPIKDIIRCEANSNYTIFYLNNHKKMTVSKTMGDFEELLLDYDFFRVHYSHLVNLHCIEKYNKGRGGTVFMQDGTEIEVSVRRKEEFLKKMNSIF